MTSLANPLITIQFWGAFASSPSDEHFNRLVAHRVGTSVHRQTRGHLPGERPAQLAHSPQCMAEA
jgi:hypothetical protein